MPVKRRVLGAGLAGLGQALSGLGEMRVRRRELDEQRQAESAAKADASRQALLRDLRTQIGNTPQQADLLLQLAQADPLLSGVDLGAFKPDPNILATLQRQKENEAQQDVMMAGAKARATAEGSGRGQATVAEETLPFRTKESSQLAEAQNLGANSPAVGRARASNEQLMTPIAVERAGKEAGARAKAEADFAASQPLPPGLTDDQRAAALQLGTAFRTESQTFKTREESFRTVLAAVKDPSAAGDLSLIFGYMRMLDPGSTVREGEFANAQNTAGVPTQIRNLWNRMLSGERLAPEQRADFLRQAFATYQAAKVGQQRVIRDYMDRAVQFGVNPSLVIRDVDPELDKEPQVTPGSTLNRLLGNQPPRPLTPVERR